MCLKFIAIIFLKCYPPLHQHPHFFKSQKQRKSVGQTWRYDAESTKKSVWFEKSFHSINVYKKIQSYKDFYRSHTKKHNVLWCSWRHKVKLEQHCFWFRFLLETSFVYRNLFGRSFFAESWIFTQSYYLYQK